MFTNLITTSIKRDIIFNITILKWKLVLGFSQLAKRLVDIIGSVVVGIIVSPLILIIAFLIWSYDKGPIIYRQKRVGWDLKEFELLKFRSMRVDADKIKSQLKNEHGEDNGTFKLKKDPRVTPIGRFIRKYSIDELPQLWCVLKGDMSLVGPRPPLPSELEYYSYKDMMRLMVKPGLTCFWQVNGRSDIPFKKQVLLDIEYMKEYSLWTDIKILAKTIPAIITGRGAY